MQINHIELINFRNHQHLVLNDIGSVLIIVGNNAAGKTNTIEALQLLSMHESFRKPKNEELINNQAAAGACPLITVTLLDNETVNTKQILFKENTRRFYYNKKERQAKDIVDIIPAVLFTPDDLLTIKGSPEQRRDMLDSLGARLSKTFAQIRSDYYKALRQKNSLLKEDMVDRELLDSWNINLAKLGTSLTKHRTGLFYKLLESTSSFYDKISGGEGLTGQYLALWKQQREQREQKEKEATEEIFISADQESLDFYDDLYEVLLQNREAEIQAGRSLIGPHRDDLCFYINGYDARRFASQGQQRSLTLALKIAETEILSRVSGKSPLLLLDDVMSELDTTRRRFFVDLIERSAQVVLTTTNLSYFEEGFLERATIVELQKPQMSIN